MTVRLHRRRSCGRGMIDRSAAAWYLLSMQTKHRTRIIVALLTCIVLGCAFAAAPLVHKHMPTEQVPLKDYDATCSFIKAEKGAAGGLCQLLVACVGLLLMFLAPQPVIGRRYETAAPAYSIFTRKVQPPRAPPAC